MTSSLNMIFSVTLDLKRKMLHDVKLKEHFSVTLDLKRKMLRDVKLKHNFLSDVRSEAQNAT